ncbi:hypothetical protein Pfo_008502 [Paulownia fortunei]|nr:hypothetical protein Pfo_008502 [Paulownia fortunei]
MANQIETLVASAAIKCSAEKFYNFFKYNMNEIVKIFPAAFKGVELLEGEEGTVGCVKLWSYVIGGVSMTAQVKIEAIDDAGKSITFVVLEGDLLLLYKSFKATLSVSDGLAKWSIAFEKATLITPPPELYVPVVITLCTLVDSYLLIN